MRLILIVDYGLFVVEDLKVLLPWAIYHIYLLRIFSKNFISGMIDEFILIGSRSNDLFNVILTNLVLAELTDLLE